jgi:D-sedoheptulose 7-phosphate isomerase
MLEARIEKHFVDSADLKYQLGATLAKPIAQAVEALLACVTNGGKVLVCGNGGSAADAARFAAEFVGQHERHRPELPAVALSSDGTVLTTLLKQHASMQIFSRQVRALGHQGDVLLALSVDGQCANVVAAIEAAHEREMVVVALIGTEQAQNTMMDALRETDVRIVVPYSGAHSAARIKEIHGLVLHSLCDGVDSMLLGEQELV